MVNRELQRLVMKPITSWARQKVSIDFICMYHVLSIDVNKYLFYTLCLDESSIEKHDARSDEQVLRNLLQIENELHAKRLALLQNAIQRQEARDLKNQYLSEKLEEKEHRIKELKAKMVALERAETELRGVIKGKGRRIKELESKVLAAAMIPESIRC